MQYIDNKINRLIYNLTGFSRQDFEREISNSGIDISKNSSSRILAKLIEQHLIVRVRRNQYKTIKENIRLDFDYEPSDLSNTISQHIFGAYPFIEYQVWDLTILNQFLNHLLSHNCIFVEVESDLVDTVFDMLSQKGFRVLLEPNEELFFRYSQYDIFIVRKLISQSPKNTTKEHKISLERLLVDLVADKLLQSIISQSELTDIYQQCLIRYNINTKKMIRYASRRGAKNKIEKLIKGAIENDTTKELSAKKY